MNELQEVRSLEVIGAEIRAHAITMEYHMRGTVYEAIEIGRRLVEARDVAKHGEWMAFLESETPFSHDKANNLIKVFEAYGDQQKSLFGTELSNSDTYRNLSYSQALALLALPSGEREDFVETHDVEDMTTRELQEAIRRQKELEEERDEAKKAAADFEEDNKELAAKLRQKEARVKELEERPVDVAVQVDEEAVRKAADEARAAAEAEMQKKIDALKSKIKKAEEKVELAGAESNAEATKAKAEAERLRAELEAAKRERAKALISDDADLAAFQLLFEQVQTDVNKMRGLLLKVRGREDGDLGEKLAKALLALADAVKECAA